MKLASPLPPPQANSIPFETPFNVQLKIGKSGITIMSIGSVQSPSTEISQDL